MRKKRIAIFASGRGSNAQALYEKMKEGAICAEVVLVVSDHRDAGVLEKAKGWGVPVVVAPRNEFSSKEEMESYILERIKPYEVDYIVLAGYMRLLSSTFIASYERRIINIHPALLPAFKGLHAQRQAIEAGVKVAGCTVHFVDAGMDSGPIIAQTAVPVYDEDTEETLAERILEQEHRTYCRVLQLLCEDKISCAGQLVVGAHTKGEGNESKTRTN